MTALASRVDLVGELPEELAGILTPEAVEFVGYLHGRRAKQRVDLLSQRRLRRRQLLAGGSLDFLPETAWIRDDPTWQVAPPAPGVIDRRVEITGPTDRKMTINALNSGANVWLADFEDANSPTWVNMIGGQRNLRDAVDQVIELTSDDGRRYVLGEDNLATIVVRPRGLHLVDKHFLVDGHPVSASILDFALYMWHCAHRQVAAGAGPYFYLPKLEHHLEARWWNELFLDAQQALDLPSGTIRATTLIETLPAAFQMEEILYELREHSAGLNAGRWDYIFSLLKNVGDRPEFILPDRSAITMTVPFMRAYTQLLVNTCHRRGAHAIGGMSAFIPSRDPVANEIAFAKVAEDKQREATDGFDGSWVAHPGLVPVGRAAFDSVLNGRPNQIDKVPAVDISAADLLAIDQTPGTVTRAGVIANITVALRYIDAWLQGIGAAAIDNLMEDAATAEISRSQLQQWMLHQVRLDDGTDVTPGLIAFLITEQFQTLLAGSDARTSRLDDARDILQALLFGDEPTEFFTVPAYSQYLI